MFHNYLINGGTSCPVLGYLVLFSSLRNQGWTQRGCLRGGTSRRRLEPSGASRERGVEALAYWRGVGGCSPWKFFKIYVSENAFQAILKPFFLYSITSVLSKVRHSNPSGVLPIFLHIGYVVAAIFWGSKF